MDPKTSKFIGMSTFKDSDGLQFVSKTLTSAQILAMNTTPIVAIPAPSANEVIEIISAFAQLDYGSAAYATNTSLDLAYGGSPTSKVWNNATILTDTADIMRTLDRSSGTGAQVISNGESIVITNTVGDPDTGNGAVTVYITYRVVAI